MALHREQIPRAFEDESLRRPLAALDELAELRSRIASKHGRLPASLLDELREERDVQFVEDLGAGAE